MRESVANIIKAKYEASAVRLDQYPQDGLIEVAFIGRSNVGKSSLINSLCRYHGLARTSGQPGKTQTLNFYRLTAKLSEEQREEFFLVDLPGYGYAKTGAANRRQWSKFIEEYLLKAPHLQLICQLIDVRHTPQAGDLAMLAWLRQHKLPVQLILTKTDKLSKNAIQKQVALLARGFEVKPTDFITYSSVNGAGRAELLDVICPLLLK